MPIIKKGDKFNFLTAVKFSYRDERSYQFWFFKCDCGKEKVLRVDVVKRGTTKSCGCLKTKFLRNNKNNKNNNFKHGMSKTRVYNSWQSMIQRCLNPNYKDYKNYGGRGITVCPRWMKFENFFEDMGERPAGKTLDRKNNDKGYCKSNCRYATPKQQANNRRNNLLK